MDEVRTPLDVTISLFVVIMTSIKDWRLSVNLLFADRNLKSLETVVNMELMNVYDWLASNKLSLNVKKTNFVIFDSILARNDLTTK